jgi:cation diffusion facilitator family transporter
MYRYVRKVGKSLNSQAVKADAFHHRSDAITSLAALVGVSIALLAGKGYEGADDWAALLASGIIFYNAFRLLNPALSEIMDTAPPQAVVDTVRSLAGEAEGVEEVEKCHVRKMGFEYFVDLHVKVNGFLTVAEGHRIAHVVKNRLLEAGLKIKDVLIHVEPVEIRYNPVE